MPHRTLLRRIGGVRLSSELFLAIALLGSTTGAAAQDGAIPLPAPVGPGDGILIDVGEVPGRLDLGRLVQELERTWLATPDPAARARAVPTVASAIACWFRADLAGVARGLVVGEAELRRPEGPTAAELWAGSLLVSPLERVIAPGDRLRIRFGRAFPLAAEPAPGSAEVRIEVGGVTRTIPTPLPVQTELVLPEGARGDLPVTIRIVAGERVRTLPEWITVSEQWETRLAALRAALATSRASLERETALGIEARLFSLELGLPPELPFPCEAELGRAGRLAAAAAAGERSEELSAPGDRWLRLPVGPGGTPCRIVVPPEAAAGPRPLLLVAHGMGGSEHMYFEAHGDGLAPRLAAERGWIVAAPSFGLALGGTEIGEIVTELESFLPVDRERIFLLGHSLGAMRIVSAAAKEPRRYRALAPLSGGGILPAGTELDGLPCFLAAGDLDFGKGMTFTLEGALERAGAKVTLEIYEPSEHLLMVVDSLPDAFRFFDGTLEGGSDGAKE